MSLFKIKAKDSRGGVVSETIEAEGQRDVIDILRRRGLTILGIEVAQAKGKGKASKKRVKTEDVVVFSRQLATMVDAGLPLIEGLRTLHDQIEHPGFRNVVAGVIVHVEGGNSFTEAIGKYPQVFGPFFINMVRAGEASGQLAEILNRIAEYLESTESLRRKIKMAMMYPGIVSAMAIVITILLFVKVIPVFEGIFADFGADLPLPTKILIILSKIFRQYFLLVVLAVIGMVMFLMHLKKTEKGKLVMDKITFKLPVFGDLFKKVAVSRFAKTLGTLIASGVSILVAMDIVKEVSGNKLVENAITNAAERIREGKSIEEPLQQSGVFPAMVTKMIGVGEKSGKLEEMLAKIAQYYDDQVNALIAGLTSLIEPLLIGFLGIIVGGIVISMFLPIFKLTAIIGG